MAKISKLTDNGTEIYPVTKQGAVFDDNGNSLDTSLSAKADLVSGTVPASQLPTITVAKGGTGATTAAAARTNLGITLANLGAAASSHNHGAGNITSGTLAVARGGTGQTSLINAANSFINALSTGSSTPTDDDYYVSQYVGGGTTTTTYHRRPVSALWTYIKTKADSTYAASSHGTHVSYGTSAKALGTSSAGSASTVSRSDHVHALPALTSCTGTLTVAKGGTGATTAAAALTNLGLTATAAELNKMDGVTATTAELNFVDGVTSNIQTQLNAKAASSHTQAASTISAGTLGGQVLANATAAATLGTAQVRNIYAGTDDMTAGTSTLATGTIYLVYEA